MGLVVNGSMDLGTHIWHPPPILLQGWMTSQRERAWDRDWPGDKEPGDIERTLLSRIIASIYSLDFMPIFYFSSGFKSTSQSKGSLRPYYTLHFQSR